MDILALTDDRIASWDDFCDRAPDAWFWHTSGWLKFLEIVKPAMGSKALNFLVRRDGDIIAICPLAMEKKASQGEAYHVFSMAGDFMPAPVVKADLFPADAERVRRLVFQEIDRLAEVHHIAKSAVRGSPLTMRYLEPKNAPDNDFLKYGYLDASLSTQVLDLRPDETHLWADFRKSYHSLIRRAEKELSYQLIDAQNLTPELFDSFRLLHRKAAGRQTAPPESWSMMHDWIKSGSALLAQATRSGQVCGSMYLWIYKGKAYYGSACNDPELEKEWAIGHFLHWKVIQDLKRRGVTHYEMGWQFYGPSMSHSPSVEEVQIAFFKRGFGGFSIPLHRGEKYYSRDLFVADYSERLRRCSEAQPAAPLAEGVTHPNA